MNFIGFIFSLNVGQKRDGSDSSARQVKPDQRRWPHFCLFSYKLEFIFIKIQIVWKLGLLDIDFWPHSSVFLTSLFHLQLLLFWGTDVYCWWKLAAQTSTSSFDTNMGNLIDCLSQNVYARRDKIFFKGVRVNLIKTYFCQIWLTV